MFHKHTILSGLQSAIKMIYLIILAAVRKGYRPEVPNPAPGDRLSCKVQLQL